MYARIERFNLAQGFAELAEELADQIAPIMRRQPGMRQITLLSDESSGEYFLLTYWETLEQIGTYEKSADEWRVRDIVSRHITTVPLIEVYQVHDVPVTNSEAPVSRPTLHSAPAPEAAPAAPSVPTASAAPTATSVAAPPAALRAREAGVPVADPEGGVCPATHPIKGNHSSSGDFIYHVPGGRFYERTEAEVCFATEAEAQAAGFRAPHG